MSCIAARQGDAADRSAGHGPLDASPSRDEPMAFVYSYGRGRVFQTVLGHAAESIRVPGEATLIRRGTAWAAGQPQRSDRRAAARCHHCAADIDTRGPLWRRTRPRARVPPQRPASEFTTAAVDGRMLGPARPASRDSTSWWPTTRRNRPSTGNCTPTPAAGDLSLYLPGFAPAEIRSGVDVVDDRWHYVAATFDEQSAKLYVDDKLVKETPIARQRSGGPTGRALFRRLSARSDRLRRLRRRSAHFELDSSDHRRAAGAADRTTPRRLAPWHFDRVEGGDRQRCLANAEPGHGQRDSSDDGPAADAACRRSGLAAGDHRHVARRIVSVDSRRHARPVVRRRPRGAVCLRARGPRAMPRPTPLSLPARHVDYRRGDPRR